MFAPIHTHIRRMGWILLGAGLIVLCLLAQQAPAHAQADSPTTSSGPDSYLPLVHGACEPSVASQPATVFGVQMYVETDNESPYFDFMVDSGASWVRAEIYWANIEPRNTTPDKFRWAQSDRILAAAGQAGINMNATVVSNPRWASPHREGPINAENLSDYAEFLGAVVERYDGDGVDDNPCGIVVKRWELYNEPDGESKPEDVRWGEFGAEYAAMLAVAYPAVKAADPDAQLVFGGIAYDWFTDQTPAGPFVRSFLTDVLDAGGGAHFDVMNFHVYPAFAPNWTTKGPGLYEKTQVVRQVLRDYNLQKPIVITEAGNHSNADGTSPSSPAQQAGYVIKLFTQALAADVDMLTWFMLYDPPEWYPNRNGLVTTDEPPQPKTAFFTYQRTVAQLADAAYVEELTGSALGDPNLHVYRFRQGGNDLYVTWLNPTGTSGQATQRLRGAAAEVLDISGNVTTVRDGDDGQDDGRVNIQVGANPLIVRMVE